MNCLNRCEGFAIVFAVVFATFGATSRWTSAQITLERRAFSDEVIPGLQEVLTPVSLYGIDGGSGGGVIYSRIHSNVRPASEGIGAILVQPSRTSFLFFNLATAPGTQPSACFNASSTYDALSAPLINVDGDIMFRIGLTGSPERNLALYRRNGETEQNELLVRKGDFLDDSCVFGDFALARNNASSEVFFLAGLSEQFGGEVTAQAICSDRSGAIEALVTSGDLVDELSDITPTFFGDPKTEEDDFFSIAANASGEVVFLSELNGSQVSSLDNEAIFFESLGSIQLVVRKNDEVLPIPDGRYSSFSNPTIDGLGRVAFISSFAGNGIDGTNDTAIFVERESGLEILVRESDEVPGALAGEAFEANADFSNLVCNLAGTTYFTANVDAYGESFWRYTGDTFEPILREGDSAPGTTESFARASQAGFVFEGLAVNNSEQFAVWAGLGMNVDQETDSGIWAVGQNDQLQLLVRKGDQVDISTNPKEPLVRTVSSVELPTEFGSRISVSKTLSDDGVLTFRLTFTDGSEGVFVSDLSEFPFELEPGLIKDDVVMQRPLRIFGLGDNFQNAPTINDAGIVAFQSYRSQPFFDGLFLNRQSSNELIGFAGLPLPSVGPEIAFAASPQIHFANLNAGSETVFSARAVGLADGGEKTVIFRMDDQKITELIEPAAPLEAPSDQILINDSGTMVYDSLAGLFRQTEGNSPELLIGFGVPAPGIPSTTLLGVNHEGINENDLVVFSAGLGGNLSNSAIFKIENDTITPVLSQLDIPPIPTPSFFERTIAPRLNNAGQIVGFARVAGPEIKSTNNDCIVRYDRGQISLVAREGDPVPGSDGDIFFGDFAFGPLALSGDGTIVFATELTGNVDDSTDRAIFRVVDDTISMIARAGSPVPGLPECQFNGGFFRLGINKLNQCVVADYAATNSPGLALYVTDSSGVFQKIMAKDDLIPVGGPDGTPDVRRVESVEIFNSEGTENGAPTCINDHGQIVFNVLFGDCSEGVFVANTMPDFLVGDVNQDGAVDLLDVAPFVQLIVNRQFQIEADINQDGVVDLLDVGPFVDLLLE